MRLIIFTNRDLASNYNLNLVLPELANYTKHIFISEQVGKPKTAISEKLKSLNFFEQILPNELFFPLIEQSQHQSNKNRLLTFNELSRRYKIPLESLNDIRSHSSIKKIKDLNPDLILSVRYGKIFGKDILNIPTLGVINLHSGKLPDYRGVLASFRAILNGDKSLSTTLHFIDDPTIDTGRIISSSEIPVNQNNSLIQHILELYPSASRMVIDTVKQFAGGHLPIATAQPVGNAAYFTFPETAEVEKFERSGWKLVDTEYYSEFLKQYL